MTVLTGKGVYGGIAIGKAVLFRRQNTSVEKRRTEDPEAEVARFHEVCRIAAEELEALSRRAQEQVGESSAQIFEIHAMMLEDEDYRSAVEDTVRGEQVCAEYAVRCASDRFAAVFSGMDDSYMNARAADIRDVSDRLIRLLEKREGSETLFGEGAEPGILCADDLSPSEAMQEDPTGILAIVTAAGSVNSHAAILARAMGIPAVTGVGELSGIRSGDRLAVDAFEGEVYLAPDGATLSRLRGRQEQEEKHRALLLQYRGLDNVTRDGRCIRVFANIQSPAELDAVHKNDAGGIGLFRSEFLFLDRPSPPGEEEQFRAYREVLRGMADKPVIVRTLDIGADKQVDYFRFAKEENPALGLRGIRLCLRHPEIFRTQLRALFRASVHGKLSVMFPMIASAWEVKEALSLCDSVREELTGEGVPVSPEIGFGIMVETPAAAMIADRLAPLVDFFSVGTNDLTQYTLAVDRQNEATAEFLDPHHEAVLRLIRHAAEGAHRYGKWIGICGELAADTTLTGEFLSMGIDELSVSPPAVLPLRAKIRETDASSDPTGGIHELR